MNVFSRSEIETVLPSLDIIPAIEEGFVAYSRGEAEVPPVGELLLDKGDVHIKYGYIGGDDYYVIKIASGFYGNAEIGLPTGNGLMLLFEQRTGGLRGILLDEGLLTDRRTAAAGAIAAKYFAPGNVKRIGIVGTGVQARLQLACLPGLTGCRNVLVWGRGERQLERYRSDMAYLDCTIETTRRAPEILRTCNLVVTATPATEPLLHAVDLRAGTHITAVGSDTPSKQELDPDILGRADIVAADSIDQCMVRGEISKALSCGVLNRSDLIELGTVIGGETAGRTSDGQISVVDLTGVAVQDIKIATAVYEALTSMR
jgi:ornithine cyclodeaminase